MKIEIEYPDDALALAVRRAAAKALAPSAWDKGDLNGALGEEIRGIIEAQVRAAFEGHDLSSVIDDVIQSRMIPTVRDVVEHQLKAMARKQVKAAMEAKA